MTNSSSRGSLQLALMAFPTQDLHGLGIASCMRYLFNFFCLHYHSVWNAILREPRLLNLQFAHAHNALTILYYVPVTRGNIIVKSDNITKAV